MLNFNNLTRLLYIWPPIQQVHTFGMKQQLIFHLDIVAATVTRTLRPATKTLNIGDTIPQETVIKRSHSDCGIHTLMPNESGRNWESMLRLPQVPGAVWFAQTYVPTLRTLGEWRVFLIGGEPVYIVHTKFHEEKSIWKWEFVENFYSLQEFRYVVIFLINLTNAKYHLVNFQLMAPCLNSKILAILQQVACQYVIKLKPNSSILSPRHMKDFTSSKAKCIVLDPPSAYSAASILD